MRNQTKDNFCLTKALKIFPEGCRFRNDTHINCKPVRFTNLCVLFLSREENRQNRLESMPTRPASSALKVSCCYIMQPCFTNNTAFNLQCHFFKAAETYQLSCSSDSDGFWQKESHCNTDSNYILKRSGSGITLCTFLLFLNHKSTAFVDYLKSSFCLW